jgi:hypothetical protein
MQLMYLQYLPHEPNSQLKEEPTKEAMDLTVLVKIRDLEGARLANLR